MLKYNPETHIYTYEGKEIPSVNQILKSGGAIPDFDFPAAEYKRKLGTYVHQAIKLYFCGRLDENSLLGDVKDYFGGFKKFLAENDFNPLEVEKPLYSKTWGFAGTPDAYDNKLLPDWKCSAGTYPFYALTMGAYELLVEEDLGYKPAEVSLIQLKPYDYKPIPIKPDRQGFIAFLKVYLWKEKNGNNRH